MACPMTVDKQASWKLTKLPRSKVQRTERRYIAALDGYLHADPSQNGKALRDYDNAMAALHTAYSRRCRGFRLLWSRARS